MCIFHEFWDICSHQTILDNCRENPNVLLGFRCVNPHYFGVQGSSLLSRANYPKAWPCLYQCLALQQLL